MSSPFYLFSRGGSHIHITLKASVRESLQASYIFYTSNSKLGNYLQGESKGLLKLLMQNQYFLLVEFH